MAQQVTNYQCPACTGPLHFAEDIGKLKCDFCDSTYTAEEVAAFYAEQDEKHANAESDWDTSAMQEEWGDEAKGLSVYTCPSCSAQLICDETTAASSCPYCGNPTIVASQLKGVLKPDYIIPFKLDKAQAVERLKNHYKGKFLLPGAFSKQNHLEEIKGLYVPFWLYDAKVDADCYFDATRTFSHREGDYRVTHTDHYAVVRKGRVEFEKVPVDGSKKMDNDYMDSIEPYHYEEMTAFNPGYLPGYMADRYDEDATECAPRADTRCQRSAVEAMRSDVSGYQTVTTRKTDTNISRGEVHYAFLPVWWLRTVWNGKEYVFMMNGQTGKMVGDLPVDKTKAALLFAGTAIAASLILTILPVGRGIADLILGFF